MSHGRPFWLSSFLHDDNTRTTARSRTVGEHLPQAASPHRGYGMHDDELEDADSGDSDSEEVFYDHQSGAPREGPKRGSPKQTLHLSPTPSASSTSLTGTRKGSGDTFPASTFTSAAAPTPRAGTYAAAAAAASSVPALARVLDTSVMTMDNAVRVPFALRSAGRRTMFDVLADWEATRARQQAAPPLAPADTENQKSAHRTVPPAVDAASAAREVTYNALFPRAALTSAKVTGAGLDSAPPHQRDVPHGSNPITVPSATESRASPTTSRASTAVITHGSAAAAHASAGSSMENVVRGSAAALAVQAAKTTAPPPAGPAKPDRRLRHLLPSHLRGHHGCTADRSDAEEPHDTKRATEAEAGVKNTPASGRRVRESDTPWAALLHDEQLGSRRRQGGADVTAAAVEGHKTRHQQGDTSDISSISTESLVNADRGGMKTDPRAAQSRVATAGGSPTAPASFLARLVEADVSGWDAGLTSPRRSQPHGGYRSNTTQSGWTDLEANLRRSTRRTHRGESSCSTGSEVEDGGGDAGLRAARRRRGMLDLNQLVDDDVPPWLLHHQAEESRRQQRHAADLQQQQQQGRQQQGRALAASSLGTVMPLEEEEATAAERVAAGQRLTGKPARFCPSSTAPRNATATVGGTGLPPSTTAAGSPPPPPPPPLPPLASRLRATWKEGARLLKQRNTNATAVGVLEYLWQRFLAWKPCGLRLLGQLRRGVCLGGRATPPRENASARDGEGSAEVQDEEADGGGRAHAHPRLRGRCRAGDDNSSSIEDISLSSGDAGDEEQHHRKRAATQRVTARTTSSASTAAAAVAAAEAKDGSEGVEIQFLVLKLEAAFNVVTVRGELTWASEAACQRLGLSYPLATLSARPTLTRARREWTLVLPEPALMQVPVGLHEHLYLAPPYTVFAETRAVLSTYNFTTDALLRQHAAAGAGGGDAPHTDAHEGREADGAHAAEQNQRRSAGPQAMAEVRSRYEHWDSSRQRGVSPVRGSSGNAVAAATGTWHGGTSLDTQRWLLEPLVHGNTSATPQQGPRRRGDVGGVLEQASAAASADHHQRTPERTGRGADHGAGGAEGGPVGASPEPHPPHSRLAWAGHETLPGSHVAAPGLLLSASPSHVRPSAASVNSIAGDGFYDPLAMPALPTTDAAVRQGRLAATRFGDASDHGAPATSDFTVVLTGKSEDALRGEGGPPAVTSSRPPPNSAADLAPRGGDEAGGVGASPRALPIPPPLCVMGSPGTTGASATDTADAVAALPMVWAAPLVDDTMGHGFARGPGAEWDVPVEVLFALSRGCRLTDAGEGDERAWGGRDAVDGSGDDEWGLQANRRRYGDDVHRHAHTSGRSGSSGNSSTSSGGRSSAALHRRKRQRHDASGGEDTAGTQPLEQPVGHRVFSSTMSLSTPVPTPNSTASPAAATAGGELRCATSASSSSLSSLSEVHTDDRDATRAPPSPVLHARASRGTRRTAPATRHQLLQRERQEQQARWMRALWGSDIPHGNLGPGAPATRPEVEPPSTAARVSSAPEVRSPQYAVVSPLTSSKTSQQRLEDYAFSSLAPHDCVASQNADIAVMLPDELPHTPPSDVHAGPAQMPRQPPRAAHPLPDDEATNTIASIGFFALQDVVLSDSE